ncbi:MAG: hypothetical protein JWM99_1165 [Verrucomicrobiales bacterium]|nr:hypothetical protein [Verrucomicrobiales bacterium]
MTKQRRILKEYLFELLCMAILLIFLTTVIPSVRQTVLSLGTVLNTIMMFALASGCVVAILNYLKKRKRTEPPRMISLYLVNSKKMEMVLCGINSSK